MMTIYDTIKKLTLLTIVATNLTLTACGSDADKIDSQSSASSKQPKGEPGKPPVSAKKINIETLEDNKWTLLDVRDGNSDKISELYAIKDKIKLTFAKEASTPRLEFGVGCNTFSSDFKFKDDNKIVNNKLTFTEKYCANLDKVEKKLADMMAKDSNLSIAKAGATILLGMTFTDGSYLLWDSKSPADYKAQNDQLKASIQKYNWKLENAVMSETSESSSLTPIVELKNNKSNTKMDFALNKDTVSYTVGCNNHNGNYKLENDGVMTVTKVAATEIACDAMTQKAESKINEIIAKEAKLVVSLGGTIPMLYQTTDKERLVWHGTLKN